MADVLSGVAGDSVETRLAGAVVVAVLVDPGTGRQVTGQVSPVTIVRRHQTRTNADGEWSLPLTPNDAIEWPEGTGWAISIDQAPPIIVKKAVGEETLSDVELMDDSALPATPAAISDAIGRGLIPDPAAVDALGERIDELGPADVGADPAGAAVAAAAGRVAKTGDTMSGTLDLGGNALVGLPVPETAAEPTRLADVGVIVDAAGQGRQHTEPSRGWAAGVAAAQAGQRPARVVLASDSMGELTAGMQVTWDALALRLGDSGEGWHPAYFVNAPAFEGLAGVSSPLAIGLDRRGASIPAGVTFGRWTDLPEWGIVGALEVPTTLDVHYTAHPDGCTVEVEVDGEVVGSFDSSLDESGDAVSGAVGFQRWRSPHVGVTGPVKLTTGPTGTLRLEAIGTPGVAVDRIGSGLSGTSTAVTGPHLLACIEQMAARSEPPDLVVLWCDTAEAAGGAAAAVAALVPQVRAACPTASILHVIPHTGPAGTPTAAEIHRRNDAALGLLVCDLQEALGSASTDDDPFGLTYDGTHWSPLGEVAAQAVLGDVVASRVTARDVGVASAVAQAVDALAAAAVAVDDADAAQGLAQAAHDLAVAALPLVGGSLSYSGTSRPTLTATHAAANFARGGFEASVAGAAYPYLRLTAFLGQAWLQMLNPATGAELGRVAARETGLAVMPRVTLPTATEPASPLAGEATLWWTGSGLRTKTPAGTVERLVRSSTIGQVVEISQADYDLLDPVPADVLYLVTS